METGSSPRQLGRAVTLDASVSQGFALLTDAIDRRAPPFGSESGIHGDYRALDLTDTLGVLPLGQRLKSVILGAMEMSREALGNV